MDTKYWVVGANWSGEKLEEAFYRRGYWEMGWEDTDQPSLAKKRDSIQPGDRIAVKCRDGQGANTISIKSIGIVKEVANGKVFVKWILTKMNRHVPCKNYLGTIHGPVSDENWKNEAFRL